MRMDHHCPFAANCIGRDNYHNFFIFIMFTALSGFYAVFVSGGTYLACDWHFGPQTDAVAAACHEYGPTFFVMFYLSLFVAAVLGAFWGLMLYMALRGLTTNEFLNVYVWRTKKIDAYKYDLGSPRRNMEAVFGPMRGWWRWVIPGLGSGYGSHVSEQVALENALG